MLVFCDVLSVLCSLVIPTWEKEDILAVVCVGFFLVFCHFPKFVLRHIRIQGEVGALKHVQALQ